jgi:hypothetical protein
MVLRQSLFLAVSTWISKDCLKLGPLLGHRYTLGIVDCHSRHGWKSHLRTKDEASDEIQTFIICIETQTGLKVKWIRCDGGGEFINKKLRAFCRKRGIVIETTPPYTPQQNGVAECFNRTTHEHALAMLQEAGLPKAFWPQAHDYANHVRNLSPTHVLDKVTPSEVFWDQKPDVSTLRVFGSKCHVRVPPEKRKKLDAHSVDGILCGFTKNSKSYCIWIPSKRKFISCRDVIIYEKPYSTSLCDNAEPLAQSEGVESSIPTSTSDSTDIPLEDQLNPPTQSTQPKQTHPKPPEESHPNPDEPRQPRVTRPTWKKKEMESSIHPKPTNNTNTEATNLGNLAYLASLTSSDDVPNSYKEAINSLDADKWQEGMEQEIDMLTRWKTWELVELPPGRRVTGSRWTYELKRGPNGEVNRHKARLVAQGFSQIYGLDFDDTFSPTVRLDTLRVLLHLSASYGWYRAQDDVTGAFLHSKLDHDVYMKQPPGFEDGTNRVAHLLRSLYGLRQASRLWNKYMDSKLSGLGWKQLASDNAVYRRESETVSAFIAIHVDNFLSFASSEKELQRLRDELHLTFEMKEEDPSWMMGFHLIDDRENGKIKISHSQYISTILRRFKLSDCNAVTTPMESGLQLSKTGSPSDPDEIQDMKKVPYRELVGSALWTSLVCHPEITYAVGQIAHFSSSPGCSHWEAAKRVLKFLKGKKDHTLELGGDPDIATDLVAYSDANWAEDLDDRRSISGYVILLGTSVISWSSRKQPTVAASSTEAKYMAAAHATLHIIWLRNLLVELGVNLESRPTKLFIDNKGAIDLTKESRHHHHSKHIDMKHHIIRECVASKCIEVSHCPTQKMLADGFTKALACPKFEQMINGLGIVLG